VCSRAWCRGCTLRPLLGVLSQRRRHQPVSWRHSSHAIAYQPVPEPYGSKSTDTLAKNCILQPLFCGRFLCLCEADRLAFSTSGFTIPAAVRDGRCAENGSKWGASPMWASLLITTITTLLGAGGDISRSIRGVHIQTGIPYLAGRRPVSLTDGIPLLRFDEYGGQRVGYLLPARPGDVRRATLLHSDSSPQVLPYLLGYLPRLRKCQFCLAAEEVVRHRYPAGLALSSMN